MHLPLSPVILNPLLRPVAHWTFTPAAWQTVRTRVDLTTRYSPVPADIAITSTTLAGIPTAVHTPRQARVDAVLLYLHGGGFTTGSPASHRALVARLAQLCGLTTYAPHYRLAPEFTCPAAFDDAVAAYQELLGHGARRVLVAGDSAGAALTLQLAIAARDELGLPMPTALGLICPPLEYDVDALATRATAASDPVLTLNLMRRFIEAYTAGSTDLSSLDLPQRALTGLPPIIIDGAGRDILVDDARALAARARTSGVPVHYTEYAGQGHVFHIMAGLTAGANRAIAAFGRRLRDELIAAERHPRPAAY